MTTITETQDQVLLRRLAQLGVSSRLVEAIDGPQVTTFVIEPIDSRIKMNDYVRLSRASDLAFALGVESVKIQAPLPGRQAVAIEVAKDEHRVVTLDDLGPLDSSVCYPLRVPIGLTTENEPLWLPLSDGPHALVAGETGAGKALDIDTPIPTTRGPKRMGDLSVGDQVFDEQGRPCRVTFATEIMHDHPCYEVEFSDGTKIVADADHLWLTWTRAARLSEQRATRREKRPHSPWAQKCRDLLEAPDCEVAPRDLAEELQCDPSVVNGVTSSCTRIGKRKRMMTQSYDGKIVQKGTWSLTYSQHELLRLILSRAEGRGLDQSHLRARASVVTTEHIRKTLKTESGHLNHGIPLPSPLRYPNVRLPIHPYVLGAWIGDGTSDSAAITNPDQEIRDEIAKWHLTIDRNVKEGSCPAYGIRGLQSLLRANNLLKNKHIPEVYLRASYEQRLGLIQGLMDTDGYVGENGACEFTTIRDNLADQFCQLAWSLGIKCRKTSKRAMLNGKDCGPAYRVLFSTNLPVSRLSRKLKRLQDNIQEHSPRNWRYIKAVRPVESRPVRCITVDSPSHLYLAGNECVPTHNTTVLHTMIAQLCRVNSPQELDLVLIDPKRTELTQWEDDAHLAAPVAETPEEAIRQLQGLVNCMEERYEWLRKNGARDIHDLNRRLRAAGYPGWPRVVCVVDEFAELMTTSRKEAEGLTVRLAQKGRAAGIHLVIATQYPLREILTGTLRVNTPLKVGMRVADKTASRLVLDRNGAEQLLGRGDGLMSHGGAVQRFQAALVSDDEVDEIKRRWKK